MDNALSLVLVNISKISSSISNLLLLSVKINDFPWTAMATLLHLQSLFEIGLTRNPTWLVFLELATSLNGSNYRK